MGGFFGVVSKGDCVNDLFFGTDYHSHLGTMRGGLAVLNDCGYTRFIHDISNAQFRSKFDDDLYRLKGRSGIGVISDFEDQPILVMLIEGPIQYDAATSREVAAFKLKDSKIAGKATVYIFPDLDAGNTAYKAVQRSANVPAIGPVLQGLAKPANDLSRGATVTDILYTIAITAIQAQG